MFKEFKAFLLRGNVLDVAVGIIIGAAFVKVVGSFVEDIMMPPIGVLIGHVDFSSLAYTMIEKAPGQQAVTINIGKFINSIIDFIIIGFAIFLVVRQANRFQAPAPVEDTKECGYCHTSIPSKATRCPACTSNL